MPLQSWMLGVWWWAMCQAYVWMPRYELSTVHCLQQWCFLYPGELHLVLLWAPIHFILHRKDLHKTCSPTCMS